MKTTSLWSETRKRCQIIKDDEIVVDPPATILRAIRMNHLSSLLGIHTNVGDLASDSSEEEEQEPKRRKVNHNDSTAGPISHEFTPINRTRKRIRSSQGIGARSQWSIPFNPKNKLSIWKSVLCGTRKTFSAIYHFEFIWLKISNFTAFD